MAPLRSLVVGGAEHSLRTTCLGTPPALTHIPKSTMCEAHSDLPFPHPRTFRTSGLASSEPDPMIPALNIKRQARLRHKEPPLAYPLLGPSPYRLYSPSPLMNPPLS